MSIEFLQSAVSSTDSAEYTFANQDIGAADAGRYILVGVTTRSSGTTNTINSVTIGGVTATEVQLQRTITTVVNMAGLYIANVPTGTTGDVVVTFAAGTQRCGIGMWRATDLASAVPTDSGKSGADAPTYDIDVDAGGFAVGVAYGADNSGATTWTGITEDYDEASEGTHRNTGAHDEFITTQTNLTITATFTNPDPGVSAGAFGSWASASAPTVSMLTPDDFMLLRN